MVFGSPRILSLTSWHSSSNRIAVARVQPLSRSIETNFRAQLNTNSLIFGITMQNSEVCVWKSVAAAETCMHESNTIKE